MNQINSVECFKMMGLLLRSLACVCIPHFSEKDSMDMDL